MAVVTALHAERRNGHATLATNDGEIPEHLPHSTARSHHLNPVLKAFLKVPIVMWRMGLCPVLGRTLMIMTTTGRKSGLPRHTAISYYQFRGRKYVYNAHGPDSDWYRNIEADPHITIQTAGGPESAIAHHMETEEDLAEAYDFFMHSPLTRQRASFFGISLDRKQFMEAKDRLHLLTFEATEETAPPPLKADLAWAWFPIGVSILLVVLERRRRSCKML